MRTVVLHFITFAKKNSGTLIIGAALIIGLNFELVDYGKFAIYHLSGQASADAAKRPQPLD
jgi:hypothetical protein